MSVLLEVTVLTSELYFQPKIPKNNIFEVFFLLFIKLYQKVKKKKLLKQLNPKVLACFLWI